MKKMDIQPEADYKSYRVAMNNLLEGIEPTAIMNVQLYAIVVDSEMWKDEGEYQQMGQSMFELDFAIKAVRVLPPNCYFYSQAKSELNPTQKRMKENLKIVIKTEAEAQQVMDYLVKVKKEVKLDVEYSCSLLLVKHSKGLNLNLIDPCKTIKPNKGLKQAIKALGKSLVDSFTNNKDLKVNYNQLI